MDTPIATQEPLSPKLVLEQVKREYEQTQKELKELKLLIEQKLGGS